MKNVIWELRNENNEVCSDVKSLKNVVVNNFRDIYYDFCSSNLEIKRKTIRNFPRYFSNEDCKEIGKKIEVEEVLKILKFFGKDKSLGLDRWIVEFYLHFFSPLGEELFEANDETRRRDPVHQNIN